MTATYTFDVFSTLDGFGSYGPGGDWGGYWGKEGPELLAHRLDLWGGRQRVLLGANTYREFAHWLRVLPPGPQDWATRMRGQETLVLSSTLSEPLAWPGARVVRGDAVDVVTRLKGESDVPVRSHGSLSLNRALLAAGLVDRVEVTVFPVVSGRTGTEPVFADAEDLDLELLGTRVLDGRSVELSYRPTRRPQR